MKLLILLICTVLFDKSYADESLPVEPTRDGKVCMFVYLFQQKFCTQYLTLTNKFIMYNELAGL